jgi:hypothetical protein
MAPCRGVRVTLQRVASICNGATASAEFRDFGLKVPSMSVDLMLPAAEKIVLVLEGIGDDKIRVSARYASSRCSSSFNTRAAGS